MTLRDAVLTVGRRSIAGQGVVLGYHDVVDRNATGYSVTARALRAHIRLLRSLGFRIAPLAELRDRILSGLPADDLAILTFDDALAGVYRLAVDVLLEERAPATVFAVSQVTGAFPWWWPGSARTMTTTELRETHAAGVHLGGHTRHHPSLPSLGDDELRSEIAGCRADLEDLIGEQIEDLAYPQGHHNDRVRAITDADDPTAAARELRAELD